MGGKLTIEPNSWHVDEVAEEAELQPWQVRGWLEELADYDYYDYYYCYYYCYYCSYYYYYYYYDYYYYY